MSATNSDTQDEFDTMMKSLVDNVDTEFLQGSLNTSGRDTEEQKRLHDIDVCVVLYQSEGYLMGNPVHWCAAEYYISDKFEKDGTSFKVFVGNC